MIGRMPPAGWAATAPQNSETANFVPQSASSTVPPTATATSDRQTRRHLDVHSTLGATVKPLLEKYQALPDDEVRRQAKGLRLLSLCSGPERDDSIDNYVREWGAEVDSFDLERDPPRDLVDEGCWSEIRKPLKMNVTRVELARRHADRSVAIVEMPPDQGLYVEHTERSVTVWTNAILHRMKTKHCALALA